MAENGRLIALPEVAHLFSALKADYEKEIDIDVISATPLAAAQQESLGESMRSKSYS